MSALQGRVHWGGALSGRDIEAVNKTVSGLIKLLFPDPEMPIPDEDLEWIVRLALEARRRVKEQQKRCFKTRVPQHALQLHPGRGRRGAVRLDAGAAQRRSDREPTRCRPGRSGRSARAGRDAAPALYRIEVTCGPGRRRQDPQRARAAGVPGERAGTASRTSILAGQGTGRRPRPAQHEFSVQMRAMDADRSGQVWACRCWWRCAGA